jgi:hypothetical protein
MKVKLHLSGKNHFTDQQWADIHNAMQFFIAEYGLSKYRTPVYVMFPTSLGKGPGLADTLGETVTRFYRDRDIFRVDSFTLNIGPSGPFNKIIETIFHEMTHVMQGLRGDFMRLDDGSECYKGVHYSVDILKQPSYKEYMSFPWEVEARDVAKEMLKKWKASRKTKQSLWQTLVELFWS